MNNAMQFFFGQPDPEEEDRARGTAHEARKRIHRFMLDQKPEDLATLAELLHYVTNDPAFGHRQIGAAQTILSVVHNVCPGCGRDHDGEIVEDESLRLQKERDEENALPAMKEYGIERREDGMLYCIECGMKSSSLDDRMLRPPGARGCPGCQDKAKWG